MHMAHITLAWRKTLMTEMDKLKFDVTKLNRMEFKIYDLEKKNMISNEKTPSQMIEEIKKIIETEAKKCY